MAKIILILSIVAMGASIFFGIKTRKNLVNLKTDTVELDKQIEGTFAEAQGIADEAVSVHAKLKTSITLNQL